jgi:hypothetical protein
LEDKKGIIVPINDGTGEAQATASGTHWSLVIVDRINKRSYYYDSVDMSASTGNYQAAENANNGLLLILGEDPERWTWVPQDNCPNQWVHNTFGTIVEHPNRDRFWRCHDDGPCGPFVLTMCSLIIDCITKYKDESPLFLGIEFPDWFGKRFNSMATRKQTQDLIKKFKVQAETDSLVEEHDQTAIDGEDVVIPSEPPVVPSRESSAQIIIQDDNSQDGGIVLEDSQPSSTTLVDVNDEGFSDASLSVSDPAEDIKFDDSPGTDDLCFEEHQHRHKRQKYD